MREDTLALIDLGSNTVRLVIYSVPREGNPEERFASVKKIGENRRFLGLWSQRLGGTLTEEGFEQLTATLLEQKQQAQEAGCSRVFCFASYGAFEQTDWSVGAAAEPGRGDPM